MNPIRRRSRELGSIRGFVLVGAGVVAGCGGSPDGAMQELNVGQGVQAVSAPSLKPGDPLPGLTPEQQALFQLGRADFVHRFLPREGLGPVYIEDSCVNCHALGGVGGADSLADPNHLVERFATLTAGKYDPLARLGGDVLQTRSIAGEQPFCNVPPETVPPEATIVALRNPLQIFGAGLIDAITDATITGGAGPKGDGVNGRPNLDAMGRPGRFGWKAQGRTLEAFTATAANGTMGLTTPLLPNEPLPQGNPIPPGCTAADVGYTMPNDVTGAILKNTTAWEALLSPTIMKKRNPEAEHGKQVFGDLGCDKCHTPALTTGSYSLQLLNGTLLPVAALSHQTAALYSDLLIHDMGPDLDEQVTMGQATGTEFRTAPLWGLHLRKNFLHDGRADNVSDAIEWHGGQALIIRQRYQALSDGDRRDLLRFLRTL